MKKVTFLLLLVLPVLCQAQLDTLQNEVHLEAMPWLDWNYNQWQKQVEKDHYQKKQADDAQEKAYQYGRQYEVFVPIRKGGYTYLPEEKTLVEETTVEYMERMLAWVDEQLDEDLQQVIIDASLAWLYQQIEPVVAAFAEQNEEMLDKLLPKGQGVISWDFIIRSPIKKKAERSQQQWVRLVAEKILSDLVKENADGTYRLQRENLALLRQVGFVQYLQMTLLDWHLARSFELAVPEQMLQYAGALKQIYEEVEDIGQQADMLYQQVTSYDPLSSLPHSLPFNPARQKEIRQNQLVQQEVASQRQKQLALVYKQLAQRNMEDAQDLKEKLDQPDYFKMSEAERAQAIVIVDEYLQEAYLLQAKAEKMLQSSSTIAHKNQKTQVAQFYQLYQKINQQYEQ